MALPRKLKLMNFLADGNSYRGQVTEITQPKLAMKLEEYRAGGMIGPVKVTGTSVRNSVRRRPR